MVQAVMSVEYVEEVAAAVLSAAAAALHVGVASRVKPGLGLLKLEGLVTVRVELGECLLNYMSTVSGELAE